MALAGGMPPGRAYSMEQITRLRCQTLLRLWWKHMGQIKHGCRLFVTPPTERCSLILFLILVWSGDSVDQ